MIRKAVKERGCKKRKQMGYGGETYKRTSRRRTRNILERN